MSTEVRGDRKRGLISSTHSGTRLSHRGDETLTHGTADEPTRCQEVKRGRALRNRTDERDETAKPAHSEVSAAAPGGARPRQLLDGEVKRDGGGGCTVPGNSAPGAARSVTRVLPP